MKKKDPIAEARRYVDNARKTLKENGGYDTMHLSMNYDGNSVKDVSDSGIRIANTIIDRCEMMLS